MGHGLKRAAVFGQGSIGRRHAQLLLDQGFHVVAFDPNAPAWLDAVERADSEKEVLRGADLAIVASPTSLHADQARIALESEVPVLVEKPLAMDGAQARLLEELANESGVPLGVAMNWRFHPAIRVLRGALDEIGTVRVAHVWYGSWLPGWRPGIDYRSTYSANRELGGGVLLDCIHELDYLVWLLGTVRTVQATIATVSELVSEVEDTALLTLELASGALASISLNYIDRGNHRGCRIVGDEATLAWECDDGCVRVINGDGERTTQVSTEVGPTYELEQKAFIESIGRHTSPPVPAEQGRYSLEIIDAARRSACDNGRCVSI